MTLNLTETVCSITGGEQVEVVILFLLLLFWHEVLFVVVLVVVEQEMVERAVERDATTFSLVVPSSFSVTTSPFLAPAPPHTNPGGGSAKQHE